MANSIPNPDFAENLRLFAAFFENRTTDISAFTDKALKYKKLADEGDVEALECMKESILPSVRIFFDSVFFVLIGKGRLIREAEKHIEKTKADSFLEALKEDIKSFKLTEKFGFLKCDTDLDIDERRLIEDTCINFVYDLYQSIHPLLDTMNTAYIRYKDGFYNNKTSEYALAALNKLDIFRKEVDGCLPLLSDYEFYKCTSGVLSFVEYGISDIKNKIVEWYLKDLKLLSEEERKALREPEILAANPKYGIKKTADIILQLFRPELYCFGYNCLKKYSKAQVTSLSGFLGDVELPKKNTKNIELLSDLAEEMESRNAIGAAWYIRSRLAFLDNGGDEFLENRKKTAQLIALLSPPNVDILFDKPLFELTDDLKTKNKLTELDFIVHDVFLLLSPTKHTSGTPGKRHGLLLSFAAEGLLEYKGTCTMAADTPVVRDIFWMDSEYMEVSIFEKDTPINITTNLCIRPKNIGRVLRSARAFLIDSAIKKSVHSKLFDILSYIDERFSNITNEEDKSLYADMEAFKKIKDLGLDKQLIQDVLMDPFFKNAVHNLKEGNFHLPEDIEITETDRRSAFSLPGICNFGRLKDCSKNIFYMPPTQQNLIYSACSSQLDGPLSKELEYLKENQIGYLLYEEWGKHLKNISRELGIGEAVFFSDDLDCDDITF